MSKGLRNTMASVALATMGLFGGIKTAQAEESSTISQEQITEMAKTLYQNSTFDQFTEQAVELLEMQKRLTKELKYLENQNLEFDFAKHPKFTAKKVDGVKPKSYILFNDDSNMFFEVTEDARMIRTTSSPESIMMETYGKVMTVDMNKKKFSMKWESEYFTLKSPELSYTPQKGQIKTLSPIVTQKLNEKIK